MKYKFRRKWRHFKFWLVRKLFPNGDLSFLEEPVLFDLKLKQLMAEKTYTEETYKFMNTRHIKELLVNNMMQNLINHLDFTIDRKDNEVVCKGLLTIAEREVV